MPKIVSIRLEDHSDEVLKELNKKIEIGLQSIGAEAATYAQKETPVDTGRLRNSITWSTHEKSGGGGGEDSSPKGTPEESTLYIGTNVEYAVYVEYGDQKHTVGKKHFLRDAVANHAERYKSILEAALKS